MKLALQYMYEAEENTFTFITPAAFTIPQKLIMPNT